MIIGYPCQDCLVTQLADAGIENRVSIMMLAATKPDYRAMIVTIGSRMRGHAYNDHPSQSLSTRHQDKILTEILQHAAAHKPRQASKSAIRQHDTGKQRCQT